MKACPFCAGEIPDDATKCKHCGEWVSPQPAEQRGQGDGMRMLGEAAKTGVNFYIVMSIVGLVIGLVFFLAFWLPAWNRMERQQDAIQDKIKEDLNKAQRRHEEFRQRQEEFDKKFNAPWGQ